ncbi:MAG: DUF29 domain-containing protein [Prochlorotrichaceae cyanobacterium]|jgi:hypothetical protein
MLPVTEKRSHGEALSLKTQVEALSLYEQDFLLWSEDTAAKLKARDFDQLDLENLIEEVETLGRSERRELLNRLTRLLEHLLKRLYVPSERDYNGWELTIRNQRTGLRNLLRDSPSLKSVWNINLDYAWEDAVRNVSKEYRKIQFPDQWPYDRSIEFLLNEDFWEED